MVLTKKANTIQTIEDELQKNEAKMILIKIIKTKNDYN